MKLEDYDKEILSVREEIREILVKLEIERKFPVKRFVNLASLVLHIDKAPYKLVGADVYVDLISGEKKSVKTQVMNIGSHILNKNQPKVVYRKVYLMTKLHKLWLQYNSLTAAYAAKIDSLYNCEHIAILKTNENMNPNGAPTPLNIFAFDSVLKIDDLGDFNNFEKLIDFMNNDQKKEKITKEKRKEFISISELLDIEFPEIKNPPNNKWKKQKNEDETEKNDYFTETGKYLYGSK